MKVGVSTETVPLVIDKDGKKKYKFRSFLI